MDITITPKKLQGTVVAIPSKSQAHRILICAAFADKITHIQCKQTNRDIEATAQCLRALGATIERTDDSYVVTPIKAVPAKAVLPCEESGSTLRFMLPIAGALGVECIFELKGRLSQRPLSPLWEEMERMGCQLSRPTASTVKCQGKLHSGTYSIEGSISSQFITGLLFALSLIEDNSCIEIVGNLESKPYVELTQDVMRKFGVNTHDLIIEGNQQYRSPGHIYVEGDWSNGAFFLAAKAIGSQLEVTNLDPLSTQGDRAAFALMTDLKENMQISAADIPDLVPILSVVAAHNQGCTFTNIQRLRLKESDRVSAVIQMLNSLHIEAQATESTLTVFPGQIQGGIVDAVNDHRIAMAAAIAATISTGPVTILGANCVEKSYPAFWEEYARLGGKYE